ncbi:MAG TPA: hypothetical protein VIG72_15165 [Pontibacter sp.]
MLKVPQFVKSSVAKPLAPHYASPDSEKEPKKIRELYYRLVSEQQPERIAI